MNILNTNPFLKKSLLTATISGLVLGLASCSGGGAKDSGNSTNVQMSGAVVDDNLAFARLFIDLNGDNVWNYPEPTTVADENGRFTFNVPSQMLQYAKVNPEGAQIKASGGRDALTSRVYNAMLSLQLGNGSQDLVLSALSMSKAIIAIYQDEIKQALNVQITPADLDAFYQAYLGASDINAVNPMVADSGDAALKENRAFKLGIQLHKAGELITARLKKLYTDSGNTATIDNSSYVVAAYAGILASIANSNGMSSVSPQDPFADPAALAANSVQYSAQLFNRFFKPSTLLSTTGVSPNFTNLMTTLNCVLKDNSDTVMNNIASSVAGSVCEIGDANADLTTEQKQITSANIRARLLAAEVATQATLGSEQTSDTTLSTDIYLKAKKLAADPAIGASVVKEVYKDGVLVSSETSVLSADDLIKSIDFDGVINLVEDVNSAIASFKMVNTTLVNGKLTITTQQTTSASGEVEEVPPTAVGQTLTFTPILPVITDPTKLGRAKSDTGAKYVFFFTRQANNNFGDVKLCFVDAGEDVNNPVEYNATWSQDTAKPYQITINNDLLGAKPPVLSRLGTSNAQCVAQAIKDGKLSSTYTGNEAYFTQGYCIKTSHSFNGTPETVVTVNNVPLSGDANSYFADRPQGIDLNAKGFCKTKGLMDLVK